MRLLPLFLPIILCLLLLSCKDHRPAHAAGAADALIPGDPRQGAQSLRHHYDEDSDALFTRLDTTEILRRLFDNPLIKGDTAIWNPNFYERQSIQVSYDDSCHTNLDTILYFRDRRNTPCAVFIFATYHYFVDSSDHMKVSFGSCHSCGVPLSIALFSQDSASRAWQLYRFEKFWTTSGIFGGAGVGGLGELSTVAIGDSWTCLMLRRPVFANMGQEEGSAELYSIEQYNLNGFPEHPLTSILSYDYHSAVNAADAMVLPNKKEDTKLEVEKKKGQYYLIRLATTLNGKLKNRYYRYSDDYNSCVEVKAGKKRSSFPSN